MIAEVIHDGAADYIWKDRPGRLPIVVGHAAQQSAARATNLDADGFIIAMNNTQQAWLGYQPEEVIGKLYVGDFWRRPVPRLSRSSS